MEDTNAKMNPETGKNPAESKDELVAKLLESIGDDPELRKKLLAALAGNGDAPRNGEKPAADADRAASGEETEEEEEEDDGDDEENDDDSSGESLADLCDDGVIGLLVGFAAGAALIGGGVLLHKLVARD